MGAAPLLLTAFSIFYFADVLLRASEKYFWYDEIFTIYLSRLNAASLWKALKGGVDFNPPLFYWLTKAGEAVAGQNLIGARLPEILGFWIFCLCLFRFVRRHGGIIAGFIAMVFPLVTGAFYYAYDARPHGIVLGFAGLSIVCWQNAHESKRQGLWLALLSLCLLGAMMSHCYALLLVFPFAMAELFESVSVRRWHIAFWTALAVPPVLATAIYLPLLRAAHNETSGTHFGRFAPDWSQVGQFYRFLLNPSFLMLVVVFVFILAARIGHPPSRPFIAGRELILALAFLVIPVLGVLVGQAGDTPYYGRYFMAAVIGVCFCLAMLFKAERSRRSGVAGLAFAAVLSLFLLLEFSKVAWHYVRHTATVLFEPSSGRILDTTPGDPIANESLLHYTTGDVPIVINLQLDFLHVAYYAPQLSRKLYYLSDTEASQPYRLLQNLATVGPLYNPPQVFSAFLNSHSRFYLYGEREVMGIVSMLVDKGWQLDSLETFQGQNLALLERPGSSDEQSEKN